MSIHPTAIVPPQVAEGLDESIEIGPYCILGEQVRLGPGCTLKSHVVIEGDTQIGSHNTFFPFASLGQVPQDLKFHGEQSRLRIGDHNTFREGCTIHLGTEGGGLETVIGNYNLFMAYSHVAHDCRLADHIIMANCAALGGHVTVEDGAILGGLSGVHQFCHIGRSAFLSGGAKATQDVPPFCMVQGDRARIIGPNLEGLRRLQWSTERIGAFKDFFRFFFMSNAIPLPQKIAQARERFADTQGDLEYFLQFIESSQRGICTYHRQHAESK